MATWECPVCTLENESSSAICAVCEAPKPQEGQWECAVCTFLNGNSSSTCAACEAPKTVEEREPESEENGGDSERTPPEFHTVIRDDNVLDDGVELQDDIHQKPPTDIRNDDLQDDDEIETPPEFRTDIRHDDLKEPVQDALQENDDEIETPPEFRTDIRHDDLKEPVQDALQDEEIEEETPREFHTDIRNDDLQDQKPEELDLQYSTEVFDEFEEEQSPDLTAKEAMRRGKKKVEEGGEIPARPFRTPPEKGAKTNSSDLVEELSLRPPELDPLHVSDIETNSPSKASETQPLGESPERSSHPRHTPSAEMPPTPEMEVGELQPLSEAVAKSPTAKQDEKLEKPEVGDLQPSSETAPKSPPAKQEEEKPRSPLAKQEGKLEKPLLAPSTEVGDLQPSSETAAKSPPAKQGEKLEKHPLAPSTEALELQPSSESVVRSPLNQQENPLVAPPPEVGADQADPEQRPGELLAARSSPESSGTALRKKLPSLPQKLPSLPKKLPSVPQKLQPYTPSKCVERVRRCVEAFVEATESRYARWDEAYRRMLLEDALHRVACEASGEAFTLHTWWYRLRRVTWPNSAEVAAAKRERRTAAGKMVKDREFKANEIFHAFRGIKRHPSLVSQAVDGKIPWRYAMKRLALRLAVAFLAILLFFFLFALLVYSSSSVKIDEASSVYVDPDAEDTPVGAAATIGLRNLWDVPAMPMSELRTIDDVLFFHERATHILHVASLARTGDGEVKLLATDGSSLRVKPDGRAYWQRRALPEAFLNEMEAARAQPDMGSLTFAALSRQVAQMAVD